MTNPVELKKYRARLMLTQPQMARLVGVPLRSWVNWENGERTPPTAFRSLVELLQMVETMAPALFQVRLENAKKGN